MLKDIIEVHPQENYQLYLKFEDGKDGIIDVSSLVESGLMQNHHI